MIYLDNNATTLLDRNVAEFMQEFISFPANASSVHQYGRRAKSCIEQARIKVAAAVGINRELFSDYNIIFTSSGTEANNLAINCFRESKILISAIEHPSVLEAAKQFDYGIIKVDKNGVVDLNYYEELLRSIKSPKFISIMLANNETGVLQDIAKLSNIAKQYNAIIHCDAVQALSKIPINMQELGCDLLTISSHKCGGPIGAGCLIAKKRIRIENLIKGGGQERGFRAGTENISAIAGFGESAAKSVSKIKTYKNLRLLRDWMENEIKAFCPDTQIYSEAVDRLPNTSLIMMPGVSNEVQVIKFDLEGFAVSAGSACSSGKISSSHVLKALDVDDKEASSAVRISLGVDTTKDDIQKFISCWKHIYKKTR